MKEIAAKEEEEERAKRGGGRKAGKSGQEEKGNVEDEDLSQLNFIRDPLPSIMICVQFFTNQVFFFFFILTAVRTYMYIMYICVF